MTKTILVVEDERVTRTSLLHFLRDEGFRAIGAENGLVGVQQANAQLPDLIICDITMPELDGYDVLTTLQRNPATAQIPFIFLTKSATREGRQKSLALGANDYLAKPVSSCELRQAIAAQLEQQDTNSTNDLSASLACPGLPNLGNPPDLTDHFPTLSQYVADIPEVGVIKDLLLERFCQVLQQQLTALQTQVQQLQQTESSQSDAIEQIQAELSQLLSLTHEMAALQSMLAPASFNPTPTLKNC
jgi:two-component system, OmpR family, alkaline phosphatase synthesis response regulator PhoP